MQWSYCWLLWIFKLYVGSIVCYEHLVCLLKWRVKAVFTTSLTLTAFHVEAVLVWSPSTSLRAYVHYLLPHVFCVGISWYRKNWFLAMGYFFLKLLLQILSNFYLSCDIFFLRFNRRLCLHHIWWSQYRSTRINNGIFVIWNIDIACLFQPYSILLFFLLPSAFEEVFKLCVILRKRIRKLFIDGKFESVV